MSDIETGRLFALSLPRETAVQVARGHLTVLNRGAPPPKCMSGKLLAIHAAGEVGRAVGDVVGVVILDGAREIPADARSLAVHGWFLEQAIAIPPVPCRVGSGLVALEPAVARLVVELAMDAAGLTTPGPARQGTGAR